MQENSNPGKGKAIGGLVCGIIAIVLAWWGYSSIISVIVGIVGLILSSSARKQGAGGMATAGFVLSLISIIAGAIFFVACIACVGCASAYGYGY